jgi:1-acyl-sn-glycerol-3-phosphate acyltransferase
LRTAQWLLGLGCQLFLGLPFIRRTHGAHRLDVRCRNLIVCNHVSLLDTIVLGALVWRIKCLPMLVLGDKKIWHASWIRRFLSSRVGFLVQRGGLNTRHPEELKTFADAGREFHLVVFPEGTRGDGVHVAACQPGIHYIAQEARLPIVPLFFENMQLVSTKMGRFHLFGGWRKVEIHVGEPIAPEAYLNMPREEFLEFIRQRIRAAKDSATSQ